MLGISELLWENPMGKSIFNSECGHLAVVVEGDKTAKSISEIAAVRRSEDDIEAGNSMDIWTSTKTD